MSIRHLFILDYYKAFDHIDMITSQQGHNKILGSLSALFIGRAMVSLLNGFLVKLMNRFLRKSQKTWTTTINLPKIVLVGSWLIYDKPGLAEDLLDCVSLLRNQLIKRPWGGLNKCICDFVNTIFFLSNSKNFFLISKNS